MLQLGSARLATGLAVAAFLALSVPAYSAEDGKATYDNSCTYCHGADGNGNSASDQFWKMKIPRMTSDYIQKMSDADLKNVILNGKRKMPAAYVGKPETQHRTKVTAEQVPSLIAYIRTLKK
jgi:mono/diheme cytochrome c family protein